MEDSSQPSTSGISSTQPVENHEEGQPPTETEVRTKRRHSTVVLNNAEKEDIVHLWKEMDERLEENAKNHNLTTFNVKSILHHFIKNPSILPMFMGIEDPDAPLDVPSVKITRAKARQQKEKVGDITLQQELKLRPVDANLVKDRPKTFRECEFEEEEDDDEYQPEGEDEKRSEVDEDTSDVDEEGTDCEATDADITVTTYNGADADTEGDSRLSRHDVDEDELNVHEYQLRSRVSNLNDVAIFDELADSTNDLFGQADDLSFSAGGDDYYRDFLSGLQDNSTPTYCNNLDIGDDADDTDYNPLEDMEKDEDQEELTLNRATKIARREVEDMYRDLLDDDAIQEAIPSLIPLAESQNMIRKREKELVRAKQLEEQKTSGKRPRRPADFVKTVPVPVMDDSCSLLRDGPIYFRPCELEQLKVQLEQHVQLLTQSVVLCYHDPFYFSLKDEYQRMINKLDETYYEYGTSSWYNISNLAASIATCHEIMQVEEVKPEHVKWSNSCVMGHYPRPEACLVLARSEAVLYPELVPVVQPVHGTRSWGVFTQSENLLLVLGLLQFGHMKNSLGADREGKYYQITKHVLKGKTTAQIRNHLKNIRTRTGENILYKLLSEAEDGYPKLSFPTVFNNRLEGTMEKWPAKWLPVWYESFWKQFKCVTPHRLEWVPNEVEDILSSKEAKRKSKSSSRRVTSSTNSPSPSVSNTHSSRSSVSSGSNRNSKTTTPVPVDVPAAANDVTTPTTSVPPLFSPQTVRSAASKVSVPATPGGSTAIQHVPTTSQCVPISVPSSGALLFGTPETGYQLINVDQNQLFFVQNPGDVLALPTMSATPVTTKQDRNSADLDVTPLVASPQTPTHTATVTTHHRHETPPSNLKPRPASPLRGENAVDLMEHAVVMNRAQCLAAVKQSPEGEDSKEEPGRMVGRQLEEGEIESSNSVPSSSYVTGVLKRSLVDNASSPLPKKRKATARHIFSPATGPKHARRIPEPPRGRKQIIMDKVRQSEERRCRSSSNNRSNSRLSDKNREAGAKCTTSAPCTSGENGQNSVAVDHSHFDSEDSRSRTLSAELPRASPEDSQGGIVLPPAPHRQYMSSCVPLTPVPRTPSETSHNGSPSTVYMLNLTDSPPDENTFLPRTPRDDAATISPSASNIARALFAPGFPPDLSRSDSSKENTLSVPFFAEEIRLGTASRSLQLDSRQEDRRETMGAPMPDHYHPSMAMQDELLDKNPLKTKNKKRTKDQKFRAGVSALSDLAYRRRQECNLARKIAADVKQRLSMHKEVHSQVKRILAGSQSQEEKMDKLQLLLTDSHLDVLCLLSLTAEDCSLSPELLTNPLRRAYKGAFDMIMAIDAYATQVRMKPTTRNLFRMLAKLGDNVSSEEIVRRMRDMFGSEKPLWNRIKRYLPVPYDEDVSAQSFEFLDLTKQYPEEKNLPYEHISNMNRVLGTSSVKKGKLQVSAGQLFAQQGGSYVPVTVSNAEEMLEQQTAEFEANWSKEEDFILLTTYNEIEGDDSLVVEEAGKKLPYSPQQISHRLAFLLSFL